MQNVAPNAFIAIRSSVPPVHTFAVSSEPPPSAVAYRVYDSRAEKTTALVESSPNHKRPKAASTVPSETGREPEAAVIAVKSPEPFHTAGNSPLTTPTTKPLKFTNCQRRVVVHVSEPVMSDHVLPSSVLFHSFTLNLLLTSS